MKIGIDMSQAVYDNTGVSNYIKQFVYTLVLSDQENEYVIFASSLRKKLSPSILGFEESMPNVQFRFYKFPPIIMDLLWNKMHILPIEQFIGDVDVFIASDWTQPPTKRALSATIIYDLIVLLYPQETDRKIVETQRRRLSWVKKECEIVFCISKSTKDDVGKYLQIDDDKLHVIYPGLSL